MLIHSEIYLKSLVENPILGASLLACFKENNFSLEETDTFVPHLHPAAPPMCGGELQEPTPCCLCLPARTFVM